MLLPRKFTAAQGVHHIVSYEARLLPKGVFFFIFLVCNKKQTVFYNVAKIEFEPKGRHLKVLERVAKTEQKLQPEITNM